MAQPGRTGCQTPRQRGRRFSANARTPSRKSSEEKHARRSSISSRSISGSSFASASSTARITRLLPACARGAFAAISVASASASSRSRPSSATALTRPQARAVRASIRRPDEKQFARPRSADRVDELADPSVRVDEPELRRRHPECDRPGGDPKVAGERELEAAADRMAVQCRDRGVRVGLDRVDCRHERMRDEPLGLVGEHRDGLPQRADVIPGRERGPLAGDDHAAGVELGQGRCEPVEDRVVERAALVGVGNRQPRDARGRLVDEQTPAAARRAAAASSPDLPVGLLEDNERVALGHRLTLRAHGSP